MYEDLSVIPDICTSCGKCVRECGHHVPIKGKNHINPNNPKCSKCYHCYTVCPQNAIKLIQSAQAPDLQKDLLKSITYESLTNFLAYRRSIRRFQDKNVDDDIIEKLIDKARYIPSGGNSHSYEFTIMRNKTAKTQLKDELAKIYKMRSLILNDPMLRNIVKPFVNKKMRGFLKDKRYRERIKRLIKKIYHGVDPFFYDAPVVIIIHSKEQIPTPKEDCVLAGYNICLMAQVLGLGACYVTLAQNAINSSMKCKKILHLMPEDNVNAVIVVGYPAVQHQRIAPRPEKQIRWC